jgi:hypothetical protein
MHRHAALGEQAGSMAGEIWRSQVAVALQPGSTAVQPATRRVYWTDPSIMVSQPNQVHRASVGRRDNVFAVTSGANEASGSLASPMSAEECLEILSMGISGDPVITTPVGGTNTRLHTYKPGDTATATIEWFDGKRGWIGSGFKANTLTIEGSIDGDSTVSADLFGTDVVPGTVTAGLDERDPTFIQAWQTRLFIDAVGGTPGTTAVPGVLVNWNVQIANNLSRVFTASNSKSADRVIAGELDVTASLTFDADDAAAIDEFNEWLDATSRMVRLEFQDETGFIEGALRRFITVDIGGRWTAVDISGENQGVRTYSLSFQSIYNATQAAMIVVRAQNDREEAFVD